MHEGTRLGSYEIGVKLGEGGMGEVYRAHDPRLQRDVAIKVLPAALADDPERLARLEQEARTLAALEHPNIAAVYGLEQDGDARFVVMQLAEGRTLRDRLTAGPMALEDALPIAAQIARGLEAAHERGVIHRDLKPANVMLAADGSVKLLDFGLAKPSAAANAEVGDAADMSASPTMLGATAAGVILGTAAYMSPEQAKGHSVDRRTDIWAFGVVLYEVLTGKRLFAGDTISETIAAVLRDEIRLDSLPAGTPAHVRRLIARCLDRDATTRLRDIGEARIALDTHGGADVTAAPFAAGAKKTAPLRAAAALGAVAVVAAAAAGWLARPAPDVSQASVRKTSLVVRDLGPAAALSPDGTRMSFIADGRLWIRNLDQFEARAIAGTEGVTHLFWSPDSEFIGYVLENAIWRAPAIGSGGTLVTEVAGDFSLAGGAVWLEDDTIVYATGFSGLFRVPAGGGDPEVWLEPGDNELDFHAPAALPDAQGVLFLVHVVDAGTDTISAYDGVRRQDLLTLQDAGANGVTYSSGHVVFQRVGTNAGLWAFEWDPFSSDVVGEPFLAALGGSTPSSSDEGTLAFIRTIDNDYPSRLVWVDRRGEVVAPFQLRPQGRQLPYPCLSPDGRRAVIPTREQGVTDYWIVDSERDQRVRLTSGNTTFWWACAWSDDGERIFYSSGDSGAFSIMSKPADTSTPAEVAAAGGYLPTVVPGGELLLHSLLGEDHDLVITNLVDGTTRPFLSAAWTQTQATISKDGRWVAYVSNETGQEQIFVTDFPAASNRRQVSLSGGSRPAWSPTGDELFFVQGGSNLMAVPIDPETGAAVGDPEYLFPIPSLPRLSRPDGLPDAFAVSADGEHLLMLRATEPVVDIVEIALVQNWLSEFERRNVRPRSNAR